MSNQPPRSPRHSRAARRSRKGAALQIAIGIIAAGAIAWMGIATVTGSTSGTTANAKRVKFRSPTTRIEIEASLGELGLTPQVLAAAGLSVEQTTAFTSAAAGYMRSHMPDFRAAQDTQFQARNEFNRLLRLVQGGAGTEQNAAALTTAQTTLDTATAARQTILDAALTAGGASIPPEALALLGAFRLNHRAWDLPTQYLGDNHPEADWMALRDAISNDTYSTQTNQAPDPASHTLLVAAQHTTNALNATTGLSNLAAIKAAWTEAIGP